MLSDTTHLRNPSILEVTVRWIKEFQASPAVAVGCNVSGPDDKTTQGAGRILGMDKVEGLAGF
jgi:hypothetical protein